MPASVPAGVAYRQTWQRRKSFLALLAAGIAAAACIDLALGPADIGLAQLAQTLFFPADADPTLRAIIWDIRLPQALMAIFVGAALGLAGAEMQTVLNNPLASPFTLGVSSAAALGAAITMVRSEERREGYECVMTCRSGWTPSH